MTTTEELTALRGKYDELVTTAAQHKGRLDAREQEHARLVQQMRDDYGCDTLEELEAMIVTETASMAEATEQAEAALAAAAAAVAVADRATP